MCRLTVHAAILLALGLIGGCGGESDTGGDADVPKQLVTVEADPPGSPQTLRRLTDRQRERSERIIARDRRFRRIVEPHRYRLTRAIPWGAQDDRGLQPREVLIGTRSEAVLTNPKPSVVAPWPLVDYPGGEAPAYEMLTARLTVRGLTSMTVFVDLKRQKLAGLSPGKADEVIWPAGWPTVREPSGR